MLIDADGCAFINYLYTPIGLETGLEEALVLRHKTEVETALVKFENSPLVWSKYRWVARYHDFFCQTWLSDRAPQLRISQHAIKVGPSLLCPSPAQ